jgi:hypothetical protein
MSESLEGYAPSQQVVTTVGDILIYAEVAYHTGWVRGVLGGLENNPFAPQPVSSEDEADLQAADNDRDVFPYDLEDE